ncbi:EF-Tu/IF-2/RF-3 family GTPase [Streptomyces sp. NPDC059525]|uniref:EF-Tu/IF-2/RF-3 family GTPase n=1 Tax=Streptomyces sp. NPDC059525 TaxID=3346857 RepID=UPI0036BBAA8E
MVTNMAPDPAGIRTLAIFGDLGHDEVVTTSAHILSLTAGTPVPVTGGRIRPSVTGQWAVGSTNHTLNVIDGIAPIDFADFDLALGAADGAVMVVNGVTTETPLQRQLMWWRSDGKPRICFVNNVDCHGTDSFSHVRSIVPDSKSLVMQVPIGRGTDFKGVVDLVTMKALMWSADGTHDVVELPGTEVEAAEEARSELLDNVANLDQATLELVMEGQKPTEEQLYAAIRRVTIDNGAVPVFFGGMSANTGVRPLLDAVARYLPSPLDVGTVRGSTVGDLSQIIERKPFDGEPLAALVYRYLADPQFGELTFVRVFSGRLEAGAEVLNPAKDAPERVGKIYRLRAGGGHEEVASVGVGGIAAISGLRRVRSGETLCDVAAPIVLKAVDFPPPVLQIAVEPESGGDQDRLAAALQSLAKEDPYCHVLPSEKTGRLVLAGTTELHLEVLLHWIRTEFKIAATAGKPQVCYRESTREGSPVLEEPIMTVEIAAPEEYRGNLVSNIAAMRGIIMSDESLSDCTRLIAHVPQAELFDYVNTLKSRTMGRGCYSASFSSYKEVPQDIAQQIIESRRGQ